jgi:hypothetical protein
MSQCLGETGYLLLIQRIVFLVFLHIIHLLFAKVRTIFLISKHLLQILAKINRKMELWFN